jgi:hypothetical protein
MTSTDLGIQMVLMVLHPENESRPIRRTCETGSKVSVESDKQPEKHEVSKTSTAAGMQIERSKEQSENANSLIRVKLDPPSKLTNFTYVSHSPKDQLQMRLIERGIIREFSQPGKDPEQLNSDTRYGRPRNAIELRGKTQVSELGTEQRIRPESPKEYQI